MSISLNESLLERCANDASGAVALHLRQELLPVEGRGAPFFPATFATDEKYNIDTLSDGTQVALIDSVGSQANRIEPIFLGEDLRGLVPQIDIAYGDAAKGTDGVVSLLEAGHRLGDAVIRSTALASEARAAFQALKRGDAEPIARLAPTSLVFGAWDSRDTGVKAPRLVQSVIRAYDVSRLSRSAQYVPAIDYQGLGLVADEESMKEKEKKGLAERGFLHVPSTGQHGGIIANGAIVRDVTLNLVALRRLGGGRADVTRRYLLALSLLAAIEPLDPFLRQGCLLVPDAETPAEWTLVERDGTRQSVTVDRDVIRSYAEAQASEFGVGESRTLTFDAKLAKADMGKGKK